MKSIIGAMLADSPVSFICMLTTMEPPECCLPCKPYLLLAMRTKQGVLRTVDEIFLGGDDAAE